MSNRRTGQLLLLLVLGVGTVAGSLLREERGAAENTRRPPVPSERVALPGGGTYGGARQEWTGGERLALGLPLDVNRASARELSLLPGLGPKLASRVVAERHRRKAFQEVDELLAVRGIGPVGLAALRGLLTVVPEAAGAAAAWGEGATRGFSRRSRPREKRPIDEAPQGFNARVPSPSR